MLGFVLGVVTGLMLVLPYLNLFGAPVAYTATLSIFIVGIVLSKKPIPGYGKFLIFLLPVAYIYFVGFMNGNFDPVSVILRNGIFLIAAMNLLMHIVNNNVLTKFLLGLGLVALVNSSVAIMQYYDVAGARYASLAFLQLYDAGDLMEQFVESTGLRVFGLQPASHIFAYTSSFLTSVFLLALLFYKSYARLLIASLIFISLVLAYSVFLSAQRTAFWPLLIPFGYVFYRLLLRSHSRVIGVFFALTLIALAIWLSGSDEVFDESVMARLFEGFGQTSADQVRASTWDAAYAIISADPLFGTGYKSANLDVGIHNAFLNGWAILGIFWVLLFTFPFIWFSFRTLHGKSVPQRVIAVSILSILFLNMMFHSYVPTLNDIVFFIALSLLIVFQKFARKAS